jgi:ABC-type transporter Mla maintaining outer membrane lipid asymmetry ATPase subunit MlaF
VYERGRVILGDQGIGKSVLVRRIAAEAAGLVDLVVPTVRVSRRSNPRDFQAQLGSRDLSQLNCRIT